MTSRAPLPVRPGLTGDPPPLRLQAGPPPLDLTLGQSGAGPVSEGAPAPLGLRAAAHLRAKPTLVFAPPSGPLDRTTGPLLTGKGMTADSGFAMSDPSKRGAQAPEPLTLPPPAYPEEARRTALEGYVDVMFSVSPEGRVVNPAVLGAEPPGVFDRAALEALSRWRYTATDKGSNTPFKVRIRFKLDDGVMERGE
ncbi:MAG: TonB family protein [Pseudomonadota bacterium]